MLRKSVLVAFCALVLGPAWSALAGMDPDLAAWWPLDEGQGTIATDGSGKGNNGTITGGTATWVEGMLDGALKLTNSSYIAGPHIAFDNRSFTIALWINPILTGGSQVLVGQAVSGAANQSMHYRFGGDSSTDAPVRGVRMGFYSNDLDTPAGIFKDNTWYHVTFYYNYETKVRRIYVDGAKVAEGTGTVAYAGTSGDTTIGYWATDGGQRFTGTVDDVQIYQKALSDSEIASIMKGLMDRSKALNPSPEEEQIDVTVDSAISWEAGEYAATHDVYFGTSFDDVNNAGRSNSMDVLVSQGQTGLSYAPAGLDYGTTYYWRVDEVNAAPDNTIVKGDVWSFTTETYAYPITSVTATASSFQTGMGPENTINGSGLNAADEHSTDLKQMWMTTGGFPSWIQYEFAGVEKLDEMWVWNSNQVLESFLGFGAKAVTVEYSIDGQTWTTLEGVTEFAKATSTPTYTHNTTVDFGGVMAKFVKITITSNWGGA
ncbi:MAG: LamG-like jellyroll fold domain-containing protein, partial [Solirubrobacterales bacterium]